MKKNAVNLYFQFAAVKSGYRVYLRAVFGGKVTSVNLDMTAKKYQIYKGKVVDECLQVKLNEVMQKAKKAVELVDAGDDPSQVVAAIKDAVAEPANADFDPDFYDFAERVCRDMEQQGKRRGNDLLCIVRSLQDYHPGTLPISCVNRQFVNGYCNFLRSTHAIQRKDKYGRLVSSVSRPVSEETITYRLKGIKSIINKMKREFSDVTGTTQISNNVFSLFVLKQPAPSRHDRAVPVGVVRQIIRYSPRGKKQELAKDLFLLSLFTCGTNLCDFWEMSPACFAGDTLTYSRSKTADKRSDSARISLYVSPFVLDLIRKYGDPTGKRLFNLYNMYSSLNNLQHAVSYGLQEIKEAIGYEGTLTYYCARHTFATIAANDLGVPVSVVSKCLNHAQKSVTSFYIKPDFKDVWEVQKGVERFIFEGV